MNRHLLAGLVLGALAAQAGAAEPGVTTVTPRPAASAVAAVAPDRLTLATQPREPVALVQRYPAGARGGATEPAALDWSFTPRRSAHPRRR
jgi:uncharacterized protein YcfJ